MALQYIQATAGLQNNAVSLTVFHREIAQTVAAKNRCRSTGDQCAALLQGDMRGGTTGVHLQFAFLVNGGEIRQTTFLDNLPAVTVYNRVRGRAAVVHILVTAGINHSGICRSFSSHNLTTIFIDSGTYGISANKLPGITIFCIRSSFCAGIHNGVCCHCAGFDDLPALIINDGSCGYRTFMHPLLATIQRGVQCQSLQALSASFIDYCVCSLSPGTYKLEPAAADGGITGCAAILYPLPAGIGLVIRPILQPGTDGHSVGRTEDNLVVVICQCSAAHGFSSLYNRVSSQCRD
ncbi:Uncharacterised protein [Escherichia coli]|uniref:Uncharacterized protein n=1 Tax=Escherichia coli TaxID=562 RepID=A0A2Y8KGV8_ECOLX|nr:Uncharacterised protein [Escherichia coli]SRY48769.1 Uncharacterised protein [Escherichia coli]